VPGEAERKQTRNGKSGFSGLNDLVGSALAIRLQTEASLTEPPSHADADTSL